MKLNRTQILQYQNNVPPLLMIDFVSKVIPGKLSEGYKILNKREWFFKVHWKNDPNVPGVLQLESLLQMASLAILTLPGYKKNFLYISSADKLKFFKKITPKHKKLILKTKILSFKRGIALCEGKAFLNKEIACSANFCLVSPVDLKKFTNIKSKKKCQ